MKKKYTPRYHQFKELFSSLLYREWYADLSEKYSKFGIPFPTEKIEGINYYGEHEWLDDMWETIQQVQDSEKVRKISEEFYSKYPRPIAPALVDEYRAEEQRLIDEYILDPLGTHIEELITNFFGYDKKKDKDEWKVAYNHIFNYLLKISNDYHEPFKLNWKRPEGDLDKPMELFIPIFAHTTKEEIIDNWHHVIRNKRRLKGYQTSFKERENAGRDRLIYDLYLKYKENKYSHKRESRDGKIVPTLHGKIVIDLEKYGIKGVSESTIKKVVSQKKKSQKTG